MEIWRRAIINSNTVCSLTASRLFGALLLCAISTLPLAVPPVHAAPGDLDPLDASVVGIVGIPVVNATAVQPDGKTILAGSFNSVLGVPRSNIARLNADGTLDMGFDPKASSTVDSVAVQADGKVLLGGLFTTLQPNGAVAATARQYIARVNANGTLDTGFDPRANSPVYSVAVQADGKVLLGGWFTALQPNGAGAATARNRIARVNADGTLGTGFDPNADSGVASVAVQADGKVLLGGSFTTLRPNRAGAATARNRFARLVNDPATRILTVPSATQALWTRGGAAPELSRVTFELSLNGGASWTLLGAGTRVGTTANWQRTGLALPASGHLRARGATTAGQYNGSSGLIEQVAAFPPEATTLAPTLTAPAFATKTGSPVSVAFTLPERALPGSVTLTFTGTVTRVLMLAASQETIGAHAFTFNPATPLASAQIASGSAIPDGYYTVTLRYQDLVGNPAAQATPATGVLIDTAAPTIAPPAGGFIPLAFIPGNTLPNYTAQAVTFDASA